MKSSSLLQLASAVILLAISAPAWGADTSMLKPPKGSKVAILVFEDMECPQCARAAPVLHEAAKKYNIPLVQKDFPLRQHPWSYDAALNARYFDTKSLKLGDDYRLFVFQSQTFITKQNLRAMTEKWAEQHNADLPFVVDPAGQLAAKIEEDRNLGLKVGLEHTPTIYILNDSGHGAPVTEVSDLTQLYERLDEVMKEVGPATAEVKKPVTSKAHKTTTH